MKKRRSINTAMRAISLALSAALIMGGPASTAFAGEQVNGEAGLEAQETESTEYVSAPALSCRTPVVEVENDGRSVDLELCLTLPEELIKTRIYAEDVILGGAFNDMIVNSLEHDRKSIVLDLSGVPDLARDNWNVPLSGTLELPGWLFGSDKNVVTSVEVQEKPGSYEVPAPRFHPCLDAMVDRGDVTNIHLILLPTSGSFAEDFDEDNISFGHGLEGAAISDFKADESGCYELTITVPKKEKEDSSFYGSVTLSGNSMADSSGELYPYEVASFRKYSEETLGRDMTQNDVKQMKEIVGGFGNTTAGTIVGTLSGGASAFSAAYTVLGFAGFVPNDTSRHKDIMKKLQDIQDTLNDVHQQTTYISNVLDEHTLMLNGLGLKIDEQYVGDVNGELAMMVDIMDQIDDGISYNRDNIDRLVEEFAQKYQDPKNGTGRDFDEEDAVFDDLSEYYETEAVYGAAEEAFYEESPVGEADTYDDAELELFYDDAGGYYEGEDDFAATDEAAFAEDYVGDSGEDYVSDFGEDYFGDFVNEETMVAVEDEAFADEELLTALEELSHPGDLKYVLNDAEMPLVVILEAVGLPTEAESVLVSDENLLAVRADENGEWIVSRVAPFETEEWIRVTINGTEYEIRISDADISDDELLSEKEELSELPFEQSQIVDNTEVTVRAEAGVFPADAVLFVEKVSGDLQNKVNEAVKTAREGETAAAASYTFDIKVLDSLGNEIQPSDGTLAEVSFVLAEAGNPDLSVNVYHIEGSGDLFAKRLDSEVDEQRTSVTVKSEPCSLYTVEFTGKGENANPDRELDQAETEALLRELDIAIGYLDTSGGDTIGSLLQHLSRLYPKVVSRFKRDNSANPINAYCNIHSATDNFATTSLNEKMAYAEELRYQLIRAITMLQTLKSPTLYNGKRKELDKLFDEQWPDVEAGAVDSNGNPYCYLMKDYVRLANVDEMWDFWHPLRKHDSKVKQLYIDDGTNHVSTAEFARRMNGRRLEEELELAGIVNLEEVRNEFFENSGGFNRHDKIKIQGLAFEYDRWGKYGAKTFSKKDNVPALAKTKGYGDDSWSWFYEDKDYLIMSPQFILWDANAMNYNRSFCPNGAAIVHYVTKGSGGSKESYHEYLIPLTFLVKIGK